MSDTALYAAIDAYFAGERQLALTLIPFGLVALGAAFWAWRAHPGGFGLPLAISLLLLGLGGLGVGGGLAVKTPTQVAELKAKHGEAPAEALSEERARMVKVNANWKVLETIWTGLIAVGVALIMLGGREWTSGLGLGLLLIGATFMTIDVTAEQRARVYGAVLDGG